MMKCLIWRNWFVLCFLLCGMCLAEAVNERGVAIVPKAEDDGVQKYAFIVAVSDYDTGISNLQCTVKDARDFKEQLLKLGFEEQNIDLLTSEENFADLPLKKKILSRYDNLLKRVKEGDWVVVYLSGHGVKLQGKEGSWFCPSDTDVENMAETTVSIDEMLKKLSDSKAGFRWMIVDACRNIPEGSKGIFEGIKSTPAQVLETVADPPKNIMLMQSCQPGQCSYEVVSEGNGIFTMSLLEALSMDADKDQDGTVKFSEIFQYVSERTNELANHHVKKSQIPQLTGQITDFDFLRDVNFPKAEELLADALKKLEAEEFKTALSLAEQACKLCPNIRKFKEEKEKIERKIKSAEPPEQPEVTWPADGLTLQQAYDSTAEGGTLTILRGVHDVPETLVIRKNITITGQSSNRDNIVLKGGEKNVLRLETGFATIKNLTFQNKGDLQIGTSKEASQERKVKRNLFNVEHAAVSVQAPQCVFENCVFTSEVGCGFAVNEKDAAPVLTNCKADDCGGVGFRISDGACGKFTNCEASGNALSGIQVSDSGTNPTVENCRFTDSKEGGGISIWQGASGTFTDCEASGNAGNGIIVDGNDTNPTVEKCQFTDSEQWNGIAVGNGASGTFTDCTSSGNKLNGIIVDGNGTNPTVEKCRFTNSQQRCGIAVVNGASGTFTDCEASGNTGNGIAVANGSSGTFTNCEASGNIEHGIIVDGNGTNPTVERCRFTNSQRRCGIAVANGSSGTFTDCEANGNKQNGIIVDGNGTNPTVERCRFTNSQQGCGIGVDNGASGKFTDCEASGNTGNGIAVANGSSGTFTDCEANGNKLNGIIVALGASGTFTNCTSSENIGHGIIVDGNGTNPTVERCRFTNSQQLCGIAVGNGASGTFTDCEANGNKLNGIIVALGASGTFTNCEASGNALVGIEVRDSGTNPTVEKCRFMDSKEGGGIYIWQGASGTFTDCEASGNALSGIEVADSGTNPTVEKCRSTENQQAGIAVINGASGTFQENTLSGNKNGNWDVDDDSSPICIDNTPNYDDDSIFK